MTKILDAKKDLSVQVHPDDAYAEEHEHELGKTECWYILDCEPGTEIIIGHNASSKEELKQMIDEGEIWIRIFEDGEDIIFQVEDNGIGMTEEQCREILRKEPGDRTGIGIKNVNDRIKIYFGSNYGLNITSELDEGTCVTIRMPKVREEEYEKK